MVVLALTVGVVSRRLPPSVSGTVTSAGPVNADVDIIRMRDHVWVAGLARTPMGATRSWPTGQGSAAVSWLDP
jgi:hypothetical protein